MSIAGKKKRNLCVSLCNRLNILSVCVCVCVCVCLARAIQSAYKKRRELLEGFFFPKPLKEEKKRIS